MALRRYIAASITAAALIALAGCSNAASGSSPQAAPSLEPIPTVLAAVDLHLPVEDYLPTTEQQDRQGQAQLALVRTCMARFGFTYAVTAAPGSLYGPRSLTDRRYGITDAALAATYGYGLGDRDPARQTRPEKPQIGPDGETVLSGQGQSIIKGLDVPEGGCIGEADRALKQGVPRGADLQKGNMLQFRSFEQSKADSRVQAVIASWSACMAQAGLHYADPFAATGDPAFIGPVTAQQIAVAKADIDCKGKTNLVGVWFAVESAYQRQAIAADPDGFAATKEAIAIRDRAAAAALR